MSFDPPESFNLADYLLDERVREGRGERTALACGDRRLTYRDVQALANRFGHVLRHLGVQPEQRVIVALPDGPEFVGALFGVIKIGAVAVMVNSGGRSRGRGRPPRVHAGGGGGGRGLRVSSGSPPRPGARGG